MDKQNNEFRKLFDADGELITKPDGTVEMKEDLHRAIQEAQSAPDPHPATDQVAADAIQNLAKAASKLVLADGSPVPAHWPVFAINEFITIKDCRFRVVYIGKDTLVLEAANLPIVGEGDES